MQGTTAIAKEVKKYKQLSNVKKEEYVNASYSYQRQVEERIHGVFDGHDATDVEQLIIEQIRDSVQKLPFHYLSNSEDAKKKSAITEIGLSVPCARTIIYREGLKTVESIANKPVKEVISIIRETHKKSLNSDKVDAEFLSYIRGYVNYWQKGIDENDGEESEFDAESISELLVGIEIEL